MENYREIKNYIHNELKISKEDIDKIILKMIQDEVHKVFKDEQYIKDTIKNIIWTEVNKEMVGENSWHTIHDMTNIIKNEINNTICEEVKNKINISLKEEI